MRVKVDESLKFMKRNFEIKELMMEGLKYMAPNRKRKNRVHVVDEESRAFKKVWYSDHGRKIRIILREELGAAAGVKDAARLYFREIWREYKDVRK